MIFDKCVAWCGFARVGGQKGRARFDREHQTLHTRSGGQKLHMLGWLHTRVHTHALSLSLSLSRSLSLPHTHTESIISLQLGLFCNAKPLFAVMHDFATPSRVGAKRKR